MKYKVIFEIEGFYFYRTFDDFGDVCKLISGFTRKMWFEVREKDEAGLWQPMDTGCGCGK